MTNYIDQLSEKEEKLLLDALYYSPYQNGFRTGNETYYENGYKVFHSFDHDYSSSKDYDDTYIYISDFDLKSNFCRTPRLQTFYSFMLSKFGKDWAEKAIEYFKEESKKQNQTFVDSIQYIEDLMSQNPQDTEEELIAE